jgi:hypothetical protein
MWQNDGRLRHVPGFAVEEPEARNIGGLKVHKDFPRMLPNSPSCHATVDA